MLNALLLCAAITSPPAQWGGCSDGCHLHLEGQVGQYVARAWEEADAPVTAENPIPLPTGAHAEDLKRDAEAGRKYSAEIDKELKPTKNAEYQERVNRIGADLAKIANANAVRVSWGDRRLNPFEYTFKVVQGEDVNAFSLPGGIIYIYDGLVKYAESDHELAGVVAHEISHAAFRHVATLQREANRLSVIQIPLILAAIFGGGSGAGVGALQVGSLATQAITSGWSQKAEIAADYGGLQYMVLSNYNPTGILTFMERLARDERSRPFIDWGIYRTHPPSQERAQNLITALRAAGVPIRRSQVTTTFRTQVKPGDGVVELWFAGRRLAGLAGPEALARADAAAVRLDAFFDEVPELFHVQPGEDGLIEGKGRPLLEVTADDASAAKMTAPELKERTIRNLRAALFGLAYRIWDR